MPIDLAMRKDVKRGMVGRFDLNNKKTNSIKCAFKGYSIFKGVNPKNFLTKQT